MLPTEGDAPIAGDHRTHQQHAGQHQRQSTIHDSTLLVANYPVQPAMDLID
jgi:hypothetical protein